VQVHVDTCDGVALLPACGEVWSSMARGHHHTVPPLDSQICDDGEAEADGEGPNSSQTARLIFGSITLGDQREQERCPLAVG
jgi:hypothetical protein